MKGTVLLLYFVTFLCPSFCRVSDMPQKMEALDNLVEDEEPRDLEQLKEELERVAYQHPVGEDDKEDEEEKLMSLEKAEDGVCTVRPFTASALQGRTAKVHDGFRWAMGRITSYANDCGVKIYVTSSFRKVNRPIVGGIVPQATRSNHYIGHAIDMNVIYRGRWCNSRCLMGASRPTEVSCFINKIRGNSGLRWGGDFSRRDPVHIDDGYNIRQPSSYSRLYQQLQKNC